MRVRDSEKERSRKRASDSVSVCLRWVEMPLKRVSMVTLMQFLSQSLHSLSPALDNELANALPSPPPHWAYLLCTKGSERYFWSPSSHLFPWFGDDNNHCGFRCHIQINCHSSSAIGPASPCLAKSVPAPPSVCFSLPSLTSPGSNTKSIEAARLDMFPCWAYSNQVFEN